MRYLLRVLQTPHLVSYIKSNCRLIAGMKIIIHLVRYTLLISLLSNRAVPPPDLPNTPSDVYQVSPQNKSVSAEEASLPAKCSATSPIHAFPTIQ